MVERSETHQEPDARHNDGFRCAQPILRASSAERAIMKQQPRRHSHPITRRTMLAAAGAAVASPALATECPVGPAPHPKGPLVFMNYDQVELDAAYDNSTYEPLMGQVSQRIDSISEATRARLGEPQRMAYGPSAIE